MKAINLTNGSLLIVIPQAFVQGITTMAFVKGGPRYDTQGKEGLSHLVEHLMYRGTKTWPTRFELAAVLEKKGAIFEGFSHKEINQYWIRSMSEDAELAIKNLIDRLYFSQFKLTDIEQEKEVVREERRVCVSNPENYIWEMWHETVWKGHPLGRMYTGSDTSIQSITRDDIMNYVKKYYQPNRIVFVVSGDAEGSAIAKIFNSYLPANEAIHKNTSTNKYVWVPKKHVKKIHTDSENITLMIGYPTVCYCHKDVAVLELISCLLGDGYSSRLRSSVMERGYTYDISSAVCHVSDIGYIAIKCTTPQSLLPEVLKIITNEFQKLRDTPISAYELSMIKRYYEVSTTLNIETSYDWAYWYGEQGIYDPKHIKGIEEKLRSNRRVNAGDIIQVAQSYFRPSQLCTVLLGDV